jgi:glucose-6-phosphate-specific signal transduction histidine kinase
VDDVFETKEEKLTRQALEKAETANQTAIKSLGVAKKANCLAWIGIAAAIVIPSFFSNEQIKQADIQIEQAKQQILQSESQLKREKEEELQDSAFRHSIKMNLDSIILLEKKIFKVIKRPK